MNMAKNPFQQLDVIRNISKQKGKVQDCYQLLYHEKLWMKAYNNIFQHQLSYNEKTFQYDFIKEGIQRIRNGSFRFQMHTSNCSSKPIKEEMITQESCLLEVIHMILRAVYDPSDKTREKNDPQSALKQVQQMDIDITWGLYGELNESCEQTLLEGFLDHLGNKIEDHRFFLLFHHIVKNRILIDNSMINPHKYPSKKPLREFLINIMFSNVDVFIKRLKNDLTRKLNIHYAYSLEREGNKVFTTYIRTGKFF